MTDEEIFFSDYKEYEAGGRKFAIGSINFYDEEGAADMAARMAAIMPAVIPSTGVDTTLAQVSIFHDDISVNYLVPADTTAAEVIEAAFGEKTVFDGVSYVLRPGISRRQVLAPEITNLLTSHPTE